MERWFEEVKSGTIHDLERYPTMCLSRNCGRLDCTGCSDLAVLNAHKKYIAEKNRSQR